MKQFIETGKITSTRGLNGELKVQVWCNTLKDFLKFKTFFLDDADSCALKVVSSRVFKNVVILELENINTVFKAKELVGKILYVNRKDIKLEKGQYLLADLVGLKAVDIKDHKEYGIITDVISSKTNIYEVTNTDGKKYLVPDLKDIVLKIDLLDNKMFLKPIEGLFDCEY